MSATVSAPAVESVAPVKSTASISVEASASPHDATVVSATCVSVAVCSMSIAPRIPANIAVPVAPAWVTPSCISPVAWVTPISRMAPSIVIPRSNTNEDSANEPSRAIETVRGAGIRVIGIVPIGTCRRSASVSRASIALISVAPVGIALIGGALVRLALILLVLILWALILLALVRVIWVVSNPGSPFNLRLRVSHRQHQSREQCKMFHVSHRSPCARPAKTPIGSVNPLETGGLGG